MVAPVPNGDIAATIPIGLWLGQLDDTEVLERFSQLAKLKAQLRLATTTLATKMRLTNQSRYPTRTAARREQATRTKPWDLGQDGSQLDRSS